MAVEEILIAGPWSRSPSVQPSRSVWSPSSPIRVAGMGVDSSRYTPLREGQLTGEPFGREVGIPDLRGLSARYGVMGGCSWSPRPINWSRNIRAFTDRSGMLATKSARELIA